MLSEMVFDEDMEIIHFCLNPCCSGRCSVRHLGRGICPTCKEVLILVVVEDAQWDWLKSTEKERVYTVLILVVVEDAQWGLNDFPHVATTLSVLILVVVEDAQWEVPVYSFIYLFNIVLILVVVEDAQWGPWARGQRFLRVLVLILVVVEDAQWEWWELEWVAGLLRLNPCCSGRCSVRGAVHAPYVK